MSFANADQANPQIPKKFVQFKQVGIHVRVLITRRKKHDVVLNPLSPELKKKAVVFTVKGFQDRFEDVISGEKVPSVNVAKQ